MFGPTLSIPRQRHREREPAACGRPADDEVLTPIGVSSLFRPPPSPTPPAKYATPPPLLFGEASHIPWYGSQPEPNKAVSRDDCAGEMTGPSPEKSKSHIKFSQGRREDDAGEWWDGIEYDEGSSRVAWPDHAHARCSGAHDADKVTSTDHGRDVTKPGEEMAPRRSLRKRQLHQTKPFTFDKYQYQLAMSQCRGVKDDMVERAVLEGMATSAITTKSTVGRRKGPQKTALTTSTACTGSISRPSISRASDAGMPSGSCSAKVAHTTLRAWLDGFHGGAAPIALSKCRNIDGLVTCISQSWRWRFEGKDFAYAIASFPWLGDDHNILIRAGMDDSFEQLIDEVERAPVWKNKDSQVCVVKLVVYTD